MIMNMRMKMRMKTVRMRMRMRRMRIRMARMSSTLPCLHKKGRVSTAVTAGAAIQGTASHRSTTHQGAAAASGATTTHQGAAAASSPQQLHEGAAASYAAAAASYPGGAAASYAHHPGAAAPTPSHPLSPPHLLPGPPTGGFGLSHSEAKQSKQQVQLELAQLQLSLGKHQNMLSKSPNMSKSRIRTKRAAVVTIAAGTGAYYAKVVASALCQRTAWLAKLPGRGGCKAQAKSQGQRAAGTTCTSPQAQAKKPLTPATSPPSQSASGRDAGR